MFILFLFLGQKEKESWKIWAVSRQQVIQNVLRYAEVRKTLLEDVLTYM